MSARLPLKHVLRTDRQGHIPRPLRLYARAEIDNIDATIALQDRKQYPEPWLRALADARVWLLSERRTTIRTALKKPWVKP